MVNEKYIPYGVSAYYFLIGGLSGGMILGTLKQMLWPTVPNFGFVPGILMVFLLIAFAPDFARYFRKLIDKQEARYG